MRVLAVTSVGGACGIWNYCEMLQDALAQVAPDITLEPSAESLDPQYAKDYLWRQPTFWNVIWLNYHRGLHSRWTPDVIEAFKQKGTRFVITHHDSVGERPPDPLAQSLHDLADAFVVHEPCEGLPKQILIRQGVPALQGRKIFDHTVYKAGYVPVQDTQMYMRVPEGMPILGTVGFNFPWKNFDRLAEVTAEAGWAYLVASNNATADDVARWTAANPWTYVVRGFQPTEELVAWLSACDATCFAYECANSGTSGAIRLGLAARKPVIAWLNCRQFADLASVTNKEAQWGINWCLGFEHLPTVLMKIPIQRVDPGVAYLAHRDSWVRQGQRYAEIFKGLA